MAFRDHFNRMLHKSDSSEGDTLPTNFLKSNNTNTSTSTGTSNRNSTSTSTKKLSWRPKKGSSKSKSNSSSTESLSSENEHMTEERRRYREILSTYSIQFGATHRRESFSGVSPCCTTRVPYRDEHNV